MALCRVRQSDEGHNRQVILIFAEPADYRISMHVHFFVTKRAGLGAAVAAGRRM